MNFAMVGLMGTDGNSDQQNQEMELRQMFLEIDHGYLQSYSPPEPYYVRAKFFVFPSDYVFCNYALLEAMSHGVVPIVSRREGSELIIDDGISGILVEHSEEGLVQGMRRAMDLSDDEWKKFSSAAINKVRRDFSVATWGTILLKYYESFAR